MLWQHLSKKRFNWGFAFRGSVHDHHGGEYGGLQTDKVLERKSRALHLDQQAVGRKRDTGGAWLENLKSQCLLPVKYFLPQGHTYSNKAVPSNLCEAEPLPNEEALKYMSIWGLLLKLPLGLLW